MPVCEADPWRFQYFAHVPCPARVRIPTEDADAVAWYPKHSWVYDKRRVAETQGLGCGAGDSPPPSYPVFVKPRVNLRGMGSGSTRVDSPEEFRRAMTPDHFWSPFLTGLHLSSDAAVVNGEAQWWRHAIGHAGEGGTFDYWSVLAAPSPDIESYCGAWLRQYLDGYTGMINFETIGGRIIEIHLRFADQWPDLYGGDEWVRALIALYERRVWTYDDSNRRDGFSVVLFGPHGVHYRHPPREFVHDVLAVPNISSVQITFHEDRTPESHAMPPGGFRLAIINTWDLAAGKGARDMLWRSFGLTRGTKKEGLPREAHRGCGVQSDLVNSSRPTG